MIIIDGVTESGGKFRPSAWAEMLIEGVDSPISVPTINSLLTID